jgi:hypothetical protein
MRKFYPLVLLFILLFSGTYGKAQSVEVPDTAGDNVLFERQWSLGLHVNTNGWGLKFRRGKNVTFLTQRILEIEFSTYKTTKEIKSVNLLYSDSKSFVYGKLNYLYFLRGGIGIQHILNRKPYWGGVELSYILYGGATIGIAKPVYLYIDKGNSQVTEERYNPAIHGIGDIYGRAPFLSGILNTKFYPGIYAKGGLEFEFGTLNKRIQALEVGFNLDYEPIAVPLMAYNPPQHFFLTLYASFSLGKRYNK